MCDFFFLYSPRRTKYITNFQCGDERGSSCPDDETSDAVIKICGFTCKFKF